MLKRASLPVIRESGGLWEISQDFYRLGRIVHCSGRGLTRGDAFKALESAKFWEDLPDEDPFKALCDILWGAAGGLDSLINLLGHFKALLMGAKYD